MGFCIWKGLEDRDPVQRRPLEHGNYITGPMWSFHERLVSIASRRHAAAHVIMLPTRKTRRAHCRTGGTTEAFELLECTVCFLTENVHES